MQPPEREKVGHAAAAHPDHVLVEQQTHMSSVLGIGNRFKCTRSIPAAVRGLADDGVPCAIVAAGRSQVTYARPPGADASELDGMKHQGSEGQHRAFATLESPGGREDRRCVSRHIGDGSGRACLEKGGRQPVRTPTFEGADSTGSVLLLLGGAVRQHDQDDESCHAHDDGCHGEGEVYPAQEGLSREPDQFVPEHARPASQQPRGLTQQIPSYDRCTERAPSCRRYPPWEERKMD